MRTRPLLLFSWARFLLLRRAGLPPSPLAPWGLCSLTLAPPGLSPWGKYSVAVFAS